MSIIRKEIKKFFCKQSRSWKGSVTMANLSLDEIMQQVKTICQEYNVEHLYLFGSYATGTATKTSDIDIIIQGGENIRALKERIDEIKTLKKIDVFEYDKCKNQFLKEDMDKYGRKIY
jgi:hypothetical protein